MSLRCFASVRDEVWHCVDATESNGPSGVTMSFGVGS